MKGSYIHIRHYVKTVRDIARFASRTHNERAPKTHSGDRNACPMKRSEIPPIRFVVITLVVLFAVCIVNASLQSGETPLIVVIAGLYVAFFIYGAKTGDHTIWIWLLYGLVTGFVEVASDCDTHLVNEMKVLVYPPHRFKIGVSPAYLPLAWGLMWTELGLLGQWIRRKQTLLRPSLLIGLLGATLIALFENLARQAGWWYYRDTPMLVWCPFFVLVFEFLSTVVIVPIGWQIARSSTRRAYIWAIVFGILSGIWMCVAMRIGFALLGPCEGAPIQLPCLPADMLPFWAN